MARKISPTSAPIALLRAAGCSIGHVIGHNAHRDYHALSITPPGVYRQQFLAAGRRVAQVAPDGERVIVEGRGEDVAILLRQLLRLGIGGTGVI